MSKAQTSKSAPAALTPQPVADVPDVIALERVNMSHNEYLGTGAVALGEVLTNGPCSGAKVVGLFATPLGFMIELERAEGGSVTVIQSGSNAGVLA